MLKSMDQIKDERVISEDLLKSILFFVFVVLWEWEWFTIKKPLYSSERGQADD